MIRRLLALAPAAPAAVAWLLLLRLARLFLADDFSWRSVAEQGRAGAPWYYRVAGTWATAQGSLLTFAAIVGLVGAIGTRRHRAAAMVAGTTTAVILAISLSLASPFDRLAVPAVRGLGLTPILEHWAMTIHPPLLYLALACCLPPFAMSLTARADGRVARPWLVAALALSTLAMALGAYWSYVEQGWGGYWAWDPVENASLAGWLAALMVLHTSAIGGSSGQGPAWPLAVPWLVALLGAAASRSGAVPSVHTFADAGRVGAALGVLGAASAGAAAFVAVSRRRAIGRSEGWQRWAAILAAGGLAVIAIGVATPFLVRLFGNEVRVSGRFPARFLLPIALAAIGALVALARRRPNVRAAVWVAHAGFVVVVLGALSTTADHHASATIASGTTVELLGRRVTNHGVTVVDGPRPDSRSVRVFLTVESSPMAPSLTAYPERGGLLAETATHHGVTGDVQVALVRAADDGAALIELRTRPAIGAVWLGAALIVAGTLATLGQLWRFGGSRSRTSSRVRGGGQGAPVAGGDSSPLERP